jgi:hypothetical protein
MPLSRIQCLSASPALLAILNRFFKTSMRRMPTIRIVG